MLLNETNRFTEKPINRLMAMNISNATFVRDSLVQETEQKKNKGQKKTKMEKNQSRRPL
jgi:hypothetical protein